MPVPWPRRWAIAVQPDLLDLVPLLGSANHALQPSVVFLRHGPRRNLFSKFLQDLKIVFNPVRLEVAHELPRFGSCTFSCGQKLIIFCENDIWNVITLRELPRSNRWHAFHHVVQPVRLNATAKQRE